MALASRFLRNGLRWSVARCSSAGGSAGLGALLVLAATLAPAGFLEQLDLLRRDEGVLHETLQLVQLSVDLAHLRW